MVKYAYRDKGRKNIIYADKAIKEDRNKVFFCPNHECDAKLYLCAVDGSMRAHFRATKSEYKHVEKCPYGNSNSEFDSTKYDETKFDYNDAINKLLSVDKTSTQVSSSPKHGSGHLNVRSLRTLKQIYSMCKSSPVRDSYAGKEISSMILDDRSEYRYPKGCFGNRIIEATAQGRFYDNEKKEIYLVAPINSKKYTFVLSFLDEDVYRTIRSEIYNNRDKIIVVAGNWEKTKTYNHFISKVYSKKQVTIIKK